MSAIRVVGGIISDSEVVSKVLRNVLPFYAIKVSVIQEVRALSGNVLTLDSLVGQLTAFELRNYDNNMATLGNYFMP